MAGPITWRNVETRGLAPAALLGNAQQSMVDGFAGIRQALQDYQKTAEANWQQQRANNTNTYLDAVAGITDPNQLAQDNAPGGRLAQLRQQLGFNVDNAAIRGAAEQRQSDLQTQWAKNQQYQDAQRAAQEADYIDNLKTLAAQGKTAEAQQLAVARDLQDNAGVLNSVNEFARGFAQDQRLADQATRAAQSHGLQMARGQEDLNYSRQVHDYNLQGLAQDQAASAQLQSILQNHQQTSAQNTELINATAKQFNIPVENGIPSLAGVQPEQKAAFQDALKQQGVFNQASESELVNGYVDQLRQQGLPEEKVQAFGARMIQAFNQNGQLTKADQDRLSTQQARIDSATAAVNAANEQQFKTLARSNYFLRNTDTNIDLPSMLKKVEDNGFDPLVNRSGNREDLSRLITDVTLHGVTINGEHVDVPPALLDAALSSNGNDWVDPAQGVRKSLIKLISDNLPAFKEAEAAVADLNAAKRQTALDQSNAKLRATMEAFTQSKGSLNIPQFQDALKGAGSK